MDELVDQMGYYTTVWECEAPEHGVPFRVIEDHWSGLTDGEPLVRTIKQIELRQRVGDQ